LTNPDYDLSSQIFSNCPFFSGQKMTMRLVSPPVIIFHVGSDDFTDYAA